MNSKLVKSVFYDDPDVQAYFDAKEKEAIREWINSIQLVKGDTGERGEKGDQGEAGTPGIQGMQGIQGEKGELGERGLQGFDGRDGKDGSNGIDGLNGKDAEIDFDTFLEKIVTEIKKKKLLDISNIKNADSFIFNKTKYKFSELMHGGGSTGGGSVVFSYDISSQFDGIATTFTLPTYTSILSFTITGWPPNGNLRPIVDFTTPTNTTVAILTPAPVAGSTGIILYI